MVPTESRTRRAVVSEGLIVAGACWLALSAIAFFTPPSTLDLKLLDWRFQLRGERPARDSIAIVAVDDATIRAYRTWPMPRDAYALLLTAVEAGSPTAVGVDFQLPADENRDPRFDELLAYISASHPNVVHALSFHSEPSDSAAAIPADLLAAVERRDTWPGRPDALEAAEMVLPYARLATDAHALAHVNVTIDRDGTIRRLPFLVRFRDRLYPAMALRLLALAWGERAAPEVRFAADGFEVRWPDARALKVPRDAEGATTLDFAGDRGSFRNAFSMLKVLQWYRAGDRRRLHDAFGGRIVLVGLTSTHEVTDDVGSTPFSPSSPLLYLHANALDSCLRRAFVRRLPAGAEVVALGLIIVPLGWLFTTLPIQRSLLLTGAAVVAIAAVDQALFALLRLDLAPFVPLIAPPVTYAALASHRYLFLEKRSRQREQAIREGWSVQQQFLPEALVGRTLSHYRVEDILGRGGMGVVYRGTDQRLERSVAIKVLPGEALADETTRRRFRRTARALARLNHPHIAGVYEFDSHEGLDFMVLELVEGETLASRLKRGPLREAEMIHVGAQVLDAIAEAHRHGVVHRDLKPANVMLDEKNGAKVLDFGIARLMLDGAGPTMSMASRTDSGLLVGTYPYMAPETIQGRPAEPGTDVYGVGMILYEMGTGRRPFPNDAPHELLYTILHQEPTEPRVLNHRISPAMQDLILKAMRKDPGQRYARAGEMRDALLALAKGGPR